MTVAPPAKPRPRGRPSSAPNAEATIRDRQLVQSRPNGGVVVAVHLTPVDGGWRMYVRVSWREGELLVLQWGGSNPKVYKTTDTAIRQCRERYDYRGPITVN